MVKKLLSESHSIEKRYIYFAKNVLLFISLGRKVSYFFLICMTLPPWFSLSEVAEKIDITFFIDNSEQ